MKRAPFLALVSLLALSSCGEGPARIDFGRFPNENKEGTPYVSRNGDNYTKEGIAYSYDEVLIHDNAVSNISSRVDNNEPVLLYLHREDCRACQNVHDEMIRFFLTSGVECFGINFTDKTEGFQTLENLLERYPTWSNIRVNGSIYTPSLFLLKRDQKAVPISFMDHRESRDAQESFFKEIINFPYLFHFANPASFATFSAQNDTIFYLDRTGDPSYFYSAVYPLALISKKMTAIVSCSSWTSEDWAKANVLKDAKSLGVISHNTLTSTYDEKLSPSEAESLIKSYYQD